MLQAKALLALYLAIGTQALTYWVSDQCGTKGFDEVVMDEVRKMGSEGSSRLNDDNNENMAYSFKQVFKVEKSDEAARTKVLKAFDTIAGLTKTDQREPSDIRIYCDDDTMDKNDPNVRWKILPGKAMRKRPFEDQIWVEEPNQMTRRTGSRGCQDQDEDGNPNTLAQTYKMILTPDSLAATHNKERQIITICDDGLDFDNVEKLLQDFKESDEKTVALPMLDFDMLLSVTMFHEFCHLTKVIDVPGSNEPELSGWEEIAAAPADEAINSADAFAWLGLLGLMETRNMRLARGSSEDELEKERAAKGGLVYIDPSKAPQRRVKRTPVSSGAYYNALANLKIAGKKLMRFSV